MLALNPANAFKWLQAARHPAHLLSAAHRLAHLASTTNGLRVVNSAMFMLLVGGQAHAATSTAGDLSGYRCVVWGVLADCKLSTKQLPKTSVVLQRELGTQAALRIHNGEHVQDAIDEARPYGEMPTLRVERETDPVVTPQQAWAALNQHTMSSRIEQTLAVFADSGMQAEAKAQELVRAQTQELRQLALEGGTN